MAVVLLVGCTTQGPKAAGRTDGAQAPFPGAANYSTNRLQEGDLVGVTFLYSTNFNVIQKVGIDGSLNLENVGSVRASGTTPIELQAALAKLYRPFTGEDVVTVKLLSGASSVYVVGAVYRPGKVPMDHPMTVLEAVVEAGGFEPARANLSQVTVLRIVDGRQEVYPVNLRRVIEGKDPTPFHLRPSDVIHVPMKRFNF
jgi:polysaccharide export outer membrane protein